MIGNYDIEYAGFQNASGCNIYGNTAVEGYCTFIYLFTNPNSTTLNNNVYGNFAYNNRRCFLRMDGSLPYYNYNNKFYNNIGYCNWTQQTDESFHRAIYIYGSSAANANRNKVLNNTIYGWEVGISFHGDGSEYINTDAVNNIFRGQ